MQIQNVSNIHTHGFLLKCKNRLILPTDQSKSPKNDKNIELELVRLNNSLSGPFEQFSLHFTQGQGHISMQ